jgi:ApaG protein
MSEANDDGGSSEIVTAGVRVQVVASFLPEHSQGEGVEPGPGAVVVVGADRRYAFSYTVTITNEGREPVTLLARHWVISDGNGKVEHVRGPGVVGFQPALASGQSFTYTSGAVLVTPTGTMHGTYLMERADGSRFDANIAPFALVMPEVVQ